MSSASGTFNPTDAAATRSPLTSIAVCASSAKASQRSFQSLLRVQKQALPARTVLPRPSVLERRNARSARLQRATRVRKQPVSILWPREARSRRATRKVAQSRQLMLSPRMVKSARERRRSPASMLLVSPDSMATFYKCFEPFVVSSSSDRSPLLHCAGNH